LGYQHNGAQQTNYQQYSTTDMHLRTPHGELPIFQGVSPWAWLLECEDMFDLVNIPAENRVKWGIAHIRRQAKTWISSSGIDLQRLTWQ
jgi:hypothetical protein